MFIQCCASNLSNFMCIVVLASGKTTLLSTLACRLGKTATATGTMLLNGSPYDQHTIKKASAYVMQDDLLNGHLTVWETMYYTAQLRCPKDFSDEHITARAEEVIALMGLSHVKNVIVGTPDKKGISGGERKRLAVGMGILTKPKILFADEVKPSHAKQSKVLPLAALLISYLLQLVCVCDFVQLGYFRTRQRDSNASDQRVQAVDSCRAVHSHLLHSSAQLQDLSPL
jgi:predicted ABC-type transport system involved in lysophospholipase L1 biosynthesis ATPase subunit